MMCAHCHALLGWSN